MNLASLPKARFKADGASLAKAEAMIRRGKSDKFISDYLGMAVIQVEEIRRRAPKGPPPPKEPRTHRQRTAYAQRRTPLWDKRVVTEEEFAAMQGSARFRTALLAYGAVHGLPNLTRLQCMSEMRTLARMREEDLALADRIEAELSRPSRLKELP